MTVTRRFLKRTHNFTVGLHVNGQSTVIAVTKSIDDDLGFNCWWNYK